MLSTPTILTFAIWILTFLLVLIYRLRLDKKLLVVAVFLYCLPTLYLPAVPDVALFETVGVKTLEGIDFYSFDRPTHGTFPFLPFMVWPYAAFHLLSKITGLPFVVFVRLLVIVFVFGITFLIPKFDKDKSKAKRLQVLFLFNPVILLVTALHGQVDMIVAFFTLASIYFLQKQSQVASGISFGLSVLAKTWSIIFAPLFLLQKKSFDFTIGTLAVIGAFVVLYMIAVFAKPVYMFDALLSHLGGNPGYWGTTALTSLMGKEPVGDILKANSRLILSISFFVSYLVIFLRKMAFERASVLIILVFLIVTPGWGLQYASWVVPFVALLGSEGFLVSYSLVSIPYLAISYLSAIYKMDNGLGTLSIILGLFVWLLVIYWTVKIVWSKK